MRVSTGRRCRTLAWSPHFWESKTGPPKSAVFSCLHRVQLCILLWHCFVLFYQVCSPDPLCSSTSSVISPAQVLGLSWPWLNADASCHGLSTNNSPIHSHSLFLLPERQAWVGPVPLLLPGHRKLTVSLGTGCTWGKFSFLGSRGCWQNSFSVARVVVVQWLTSPGAHSLRRQGRHKITWLHSETGGYHMSDTVVLGVINRKEGFWPRWGS